LLTCREAIRLALDRTRRSQVDTCWMDAGKLLEPEWAHCGDAQWAGGTIMNCGYRAKMQASSTEVWQAISRIGGRTGWYYGNFLWRVRGSSTGWSEASGCGKDADIHLRSAWATPWIFGEF